MKVKLLSYKSHMQHAYSETGGGVLNTETIITDIRPSRDVHTFISNHVTYFLYSTPETLVYTSVLDTIGMRFETIWKDRYLGNATYAYEHSANYANSSLGIQLV